MSLSGKGNTGFFFFVFFNGHQENLHCVSSPFGHASLDAAGASQSGQGVLPVGPMNAASSGAAQAHVDGLAAGVHAAYRRVAHASRPAVPTQRAFPALGGGATEGGAPRQAVGGSGGGVDRAGAGGLWTGRQDVIVFYSIAKTISS